MNCKENVRELGQGVVEYALILGLVSVVAIGSIRGLGDSVVGVFTGVGRVLEEQVTDVSAEVDISDVDLPEGYLLKSEFDKLGVDLMSLGFTELWSGELGSVYYKEDAGELTLVHDPRGYGDLLKESMGDYIDYEVLVKKGLRLKTVGMWGYLMEL